MIEEKMERSNITLPEALRRIREEKEAEQKLKTELRRKGIVI